MLTCFWRRGKSRPRRGGVHGYGIQVYARPRDFSGIWMWMIALQIAKRGYAQWILRHSGSGKGRVAVLVGSLVGKKVGPEGSDEWFVGAFERARHFFVSHSACRGTLSASFPTIVSLEGQSKSLVQESWLHSRVMCKSYDCLYKETIASNAINDAINTAQRERGSHAFPCYWTFPFVSMSSNRILATSSRPPLCPQGQAEATTLSLAVSKYKQQ